MKSQKQSFSYSLLTSLNDIIFNHYPPLGLTWCRLGGGVRGQQGERRQQEDLRGPQAAGATLTHNSYSSCNLAVQWGKIIDILT